MYDLDENINLQHWYVFGDSISRGIIYNAEQDRYEICKKNFINILADNFKIKVNNFSSFGATVEKGLDLFKRNKGKIQESGIAILEFGGNDCDFIWPEVAKTPHENHEAKTPPEKFIVLYRQLIENLKAKNLLTVILNLPPLEPTRYFEQFSKTLNKDNILKFLGGSTKRIYQWHESYNSALPALAVETGSIHIDIRQGLLEELQPGKYMCLDGIHPNAAGHELIEKIISDKIKNYLT